MNRSLPIFASGLALAGAIIFGQAIAQSQNAPTAAAPAPQSDAESIARGAKAWANTCGRCHNLRSPSELNAELWDVSVQHMRVRANIPGSIADDIKLFLKSSITSNNAQTSGPSATNTPLTFYAGLLTGDITHGREIYSQTCFACHGVDGKGAIDGVPDLTAKSGRLAKSDEIILTNIIKGVQSDGSLMAMPPMGGNPDLTEQDMADVLAYLRKKFQEE